MMIANAKMNFFILKVLDMNSILIIVLNIVKKY